MLTKNKLIQYLRGPHWMAYYGNYNVYVAHDLLDKLQQGGNFPNALDTPGILAAHARGIRPALQRMGLEIAVQEILPHMPPGMPTLYHILWKGRHYLTGRNVIDE